MVFSPSGIRLIDIVRLAGFDPHQVWPSNPLLLIKSPESDKEAPYLHATPGDKAVFGTTINILGNRALAGYIAPKAVVVPIIKSKRNKRHDTIVIGRAQSADIRLSDPSISKTHALLMPPTGSPVWRIQDAGSTNGTAVNGITISKSRPTHLGLTEEIRLGNARALFIDAEALMSIMNHAREAWASDLETISTADHSNSSTQQLPRIRD